MNHENNFWDLIERIAAIGGVFAFLAQLVDISNKIRSWLKEIKSLVLRLIIRNPLPKIASVADPRITKVDGKFYMTYVAFNGVTPPRIALTSIGVDDFQNRRWDKWVTPKLISAPGMLNKVLHLK